MKKFFLFALVATMFAACVTDGVNDPSVAIEDLAPETLTVSFEGDDSRVQLQDGKTVWTKGDLVSVFYRSDAHSQYEFQGETGDTNGTLKRISQGKPSIGLDKIVAVYPYDSNYLIELLTGNIQAFIPATQNYVEDSFGVGSSIMISSSHTNTLYMKNVCGWLKLQLTGNGEKISYITLKGNNGEQVAGNVFVTADTAECTLAAELNGADENNSGDLVGTLVDPNTILTEVTLNCGEGVTLGAEATAFYIALPPQTFEKGISLEITAADCSKMTKSTEREVVIKRNTILPMAEFGYNGVREQQNNEIWYTSSDGKIVTPYATDVFGANIVSNTYENGQGIITFDGNVTSIGDWAFSYCSNLTSVTIGNSVTSIGEGAFFACSSLTTFYGKFASEDNRCLIVDGVLNSFAPAGLTKYTIPDSVTSIGYAAFLGCTSLTSVTIGNSVTSIGLGTFQECESLTSVTIPDSVTEIGEYAFYGCTSLKAFYGKFASEDNRCLVADGVLNSFAPAGLTEYTIPDSVTSIGDCAFGACTSLTSVTIGNSVTSIGVSAFDECESLTSVTIPDSITSIGAYAFQDCTSLKEVYCKPTTPPTGGDEMFCDNAPYRTIYVPTASVETYRTASYWSSYANYIISENVIFYEACGTSVSRIDSQWPYVDQFTDWSKTGSAATNVIYDGNIASVRNSGAAYQPTADAVGVSGQPYVFLNKVPTLSNFTIENIAVSGATQYIFTFNVSCQNAYNSGTIGFAEVTNDLIHLELGYDGISWATVECTIVPNGGNGWYTATAEFKTAADATKLYARFSYEAPASDGGARFDDFEITTGGNGVEFTPVAPDVPELPEQPTEALTIPYSESFATNQGYFVINDVLLGGALTYVWSQSAGYSCMVASGYKSGCVESESWLISPSISLVGAVAPAVSFEHCHKFAGTPSEELTLWVSENDGADWSQLAISTYGTNSNYNFVTNTTDLTAYVGKTIKIAFKYISSTAAAGTWEVKNFKVAEVAE